MASDGKTGKYVTKGSCIVLGPEDITLYKINGFGLFFFKNGKYEPRCHKR